MKNVITVLVVFALAEAGQAATRNNDDSCDIAVRPAATLLLPIFDVTIHTGPGVGDTTLFTITNTSGVRQIAHVTVWTDWAYPVLAFNIVLTGYDVQAINLYDVLVHGAIGSGDPAPLHSVTRGSTPEASGSNPNIVDNCADAPDSVPPMLMDTVQRALTVGNTGTCVPVTQRVGGTHTNAKGYLTIDVVSRCTNEFPTSVTYYDRDLLFDNVLIGDYQQIHGDPTIGNLAQGNPMVHIRAIPEGGPAGSFAVTNLPYTFYDRYTTLAAHRRFDRRQPLPSRFAARWIENEISARTSYRIWREGVTFGTQSCGDARANSAMPIAEIIRFDEHENSFGRLPSCGSPGFICSFVGLPAASITPTSSSGIYPPYYFSDVAGWMYLNLDNFPFRGGTPPKYTPAPPGNSYRASQNWVVVSMYAQGRFSADFDAAMLGNGCSAPEFAPAREIGPAR